MLAKHGRAHLRVQVGYGGRAGRAIAGKRDPLEQ
jgi:hypothetical protein